MKIEQIVISETPMDLVPGKKTRSWMDETPNKYAYRCLPLSIANSTGYDIYLKSQVVISWNGGSRQDDIQINYETEEHGEFAGSNFGCGIVTFFPGFLLKTTPGWDLFVGGPINEETFYNAVPLTGIVETFWHDFTFTINWKMRKPGTFVWTPDVPIARIIPIPHYFEVEVEKKNLSDVPEIEKYYKEQSEQRSQKVTDIHEAYSRNTNYGTVEIGKPTTEWDKKYYRGIDRNGEKVYNHTLKRDFPPFK